jgi:hypothetical protein
LPALVFTAQSPYSGRQNLLITPQAVSIQPEPYAPYFRKLLKKPLTKDKSQDIICIGEFYMGNGKSIVITVYGHNRIIDNIAVSLFDQSESGHYGYNNDSNAETYCNTINDLKLEGESWVFAKLVSANTQYGLDAFLPEKFDLILKLDDRAIQKTLREIDSRDIANALKGENEAVQKKIFYNMSKRAAEMLKEDMEYMGPIRITEVKEAQEKILGIIHHLEQTGEIVIQWSKGGMIE